MCGLTVAADGSGGHLLQFQRGEPCASGQELLALELAEVGEAEQEQNNEERKFNNKLVVEDDDDEEDGDEE